MGSGEFELSTDTDDESINGEADSSNILPPWEMAVDALRETRPKDRERILQLLQRLLHDNQQYRHTNMQLNDLLQKRETQVRELNEQLQHYRKQYEDLTLATCLQQQQQQPLQEEPENLISNMIKVDSCFHNNKELRMPLKKSIRRDMLFSSPPTSTTPPIHESKELKIIKLERNSNQEEELDEDEVEVKPNIENLGIDIKMQQTDGIKNNEEDEQMSVVDDKEENKIEINKSDIADSGSECESNDGATNKLISSPPTPLIDNINNNNSNDSKTMQEYENEELSNTANNKLEQEESGSEKRQVNSLVENVVVENENENENEKCIKVPHNQLLSSIPNSIIPISSESATTAGQLFDSSNNSESAAIKQAQMCAAAMLEDDETNEAENIDIDADAENEAMHDDSDEDMSTTTTTTTANKMKEESMTSARTLSSSSNDRSLLKKKKKKKERKERKEKRKIAAAAAAALVMSSVSSSSVSSSNIMPAISIPQRPPMVTKASKKQTPTTHCDLQIKQELV